MAGVAAAPVEAIAPAFADPVLDSQAVFRIVLDAMAGPGQIRPLHRPLMPPGGLLQTTAAVLLTLADFETAVWLDPSLAEAAGYIRFHTGARIVAEPEAATYAVIASPAALPPFAAFAQGSPEFPDRSATLLVQCDRLIDAGYRFTGPGIPGSVTFGFEPAPSDFADRMAANRALFPRGLDLVFLDAGHVAALPRSVKLCEG